MIHDEFLHAAFRALQNAEVLLAALKTEQNQLDFRKGEAESSIRSAKAEIDALMKETGEYEVLIPGAPGDMMDYVVGYSTPREAVKIPDVEALPEEFVKIEKKAKLREIGEHLKTLRDSSEPWPNWATLEKGEPKLSWKAIKRGAKS